MIQDIAPHTFINHYDPLKRPASDSPVMIFEGGSVFTDGLDFPRFGQLGLSEEEVTYLFSIDQTDYFLADTVPEKLPEGFQFTGVRSMRRRHAARKDHIFAAITGLQLSRWYNDNRFCGTCGTPTVHDTAERAIRCPHCGRVIYPRIVPAVIVGVTHGDELLVTKYRTGITFYALIAGFTEIGETLEQTVEREVMEEVGLHVKNIRYYKSQPWGIVDDILAGFYCDVDGDTSIRLDRSELKLAEWKKREDIELQPDDFSLTNEMMLRFMQGREPA